MNFPPYVQPFDSASDTEFIEAQLRACLYQCKQLELDSNAGELLQWVNDLAQLLSHTDFLLHQSQAVRLMTAHCHVYIMLSTVNNVPYSCNSLVDVLQSLVDQLALLCDSSSSAYEERLEMFKTIGHGRLFIRMHPRVQQFGTVVHSLFVALYDVVSQNIGLISGVWQFLSPILNSLESPEKTMDFIFAHLIPPLKKKEPLCYTVSKELVHNASLSLQATMDMSQNAHERLLAVESLCYLASRKSLGMAPGGRYMCQLYLKRCTDESPRIREACLKLSSSVLCCPEFAEDVLEALTQIQAGCGTTVRHIVIKSVTKAALKDSAIITDKLIALLTANTHYGSFQVRQEAISCLGKLYRSIAMDRVCPQKLIYKIANVILEAYQTKNTSDRMTVEQTYAQHLVPLLLSPSYRMQLLYALYCNLKAKALRSFVRLHENMQEAQLKLRSVLDQVWTAHASTPRRSNRGTQLIDELRKDTVACENLLNALSHQKSSDIASSRDAILKSLRDRRSKALAEVEKLFWTATSAALNEDDVEQLLALVSEQRPALYYSHTTKELQLFKVLSRAFPLSCGKLKHLSASTIGLGQSDIDSEDA
ncbi:sister chromatid cohesion protein PDS5 homolog B-B-like isoform X2 [Dermacentor variabilis]|uniref:sister chromatid cohesion protein PDS5 homolog B-B-like isoform X2 n=1 Tax=Dermacentor variabilis TaxID=34621 RepID=UPI003F5CA094